MAEFIGYTREKFDMRRFTCPKCKNRKGLRVVYASMKIICIFCRVCYKNSKLKRIA